MQTAEASLVLNLSRSDQLIETTGLTILEAMAYGTPVIPRPAGRPSEILVDDVQGLLVNVREGNKARDRRPEIKLNAETARPMSGAAHSRALDFSQDIFCEGIPAAFNDVSKGF